MRVGRWLLTCLLVLAFVVPVQSGELLWTRKFEKSVKYKKLTAGGVYLVMTDKGIHGLDPMTGNELWTVEQEKLKEDDVEYVEGSPLLFIAKGKGFAKRTINMSVINVMDGTENWKVEGIPGILNGTQLIFDHGLVLMFSTGGKDGVAIDAYDMFDGSPKYKVAFPKKQEMKNVTMTKPPGAGKFSTKLKVLGHQNPVVDGDHMIVYYDYLRKIDLTNGQQVWMDMEKKRPKWDKAPKLTANYAQMQLHNGVIYTPYEKTLAAFDAATGQMKWRVKKIGGERITDMRIEGDKLYYRGGGFMTGSGKKAKFIQPVYGALSLTDGMPLWKKEFKVKSGVTNWLFIGDQIYVAGTSKLYIINKADGLQANKKDEYKFKFKSDSPSSLTLRDDGLLVQGSNTAALYDLNGGQLQEKWRQYYSAPGAGMFAKFATLAVSSMLYMAATSQAMNSYSGTTSNRWANESRAEAWEGFGQVMATRYRATQSSDKYQYVLTNLDGGAGLIGINLKTGKADREVLLKEKKPDYEVDDISGVVFFQKSGKELLVYKLAH